MTESSSRRGFVKQTLLVTAGLTAGGGIHPILEALALEPSGSVRPPLRRPISRALLDAAASKLIPAGDGMPSAGDAGATRYLERLAEREPSVRDTLAVALEDLLSIAEARYQSPFDRLEAKAQIAVLQELERSEPARFTGLWRLVYEAYYVNPRILQLMGHELAPTNQVGIRMPPFNESRLDRVKKMPARYRKVADAR